MYQPYTYLIAWTDHNVFYYGVRYNRKIRDKNPEQDLWVDYFTSSKQVKKFREKYGEPDRIEVRKVFDSADTARNWETKFLKRIRAVEKENWLNKTYSDGRWYNSGHSVETRRKIGEANKGKKLPSPSKKTKLKISKALRGKPKPPFSEEHRKRLSISHKGNKHNEETLRKMSETRKGRKFSKEWKKKISKWKKGRKWYTNGEKSIMLHPNDIIPEGFKPGLTRKRS